MEFSILCQSWAIYEDMVKDTRENGMSFITPNGYEAPRPSVGTMVRMVAIISRLGAKFGLSPSDRARIDLPAPEEEDEFTQFLKKQRGDD